MQKRNRKQRRGARVYKIDHLCKAEDSDTLRVGGQTHYIEGSLNRFLIVSVPENTSIAMAQRIQKEVGAKLEKEVIVVTHNVVFMQATRVSSRETAEILRRVQEGEENGTGDNGAGSRPGICVDGGGDPDARSDEQSTENYSNGQPTDQDGGDAKEGDEAHAEVSG